MLGFLAPPEFVEFVFFEPEVVGDFVDERDVQFPHDLGPVGAGFFEGAFEEDDAVRELPHFVFAAFREWCSVVVAVGERVGVFAETRLRLFLDEDMNVVHRGGELAR